MTRPPRGYRHDVMTHDPIRSPSRTRYGAAASPRPASAPGRSRLWSRAAAVVALAVRCAVAAVLAWVVVTPLGGAADDFHYYAPFGAVVAVSTTVMGSVRASVQVLGAFVLGVPLALALQAWSPPTLVAIALTAGVGTLLAHVRGLGTYGSWVPISALFILLIGQGQTTHYVVGYLGLTLAGAFIGIAVSLLAPPLLLLSTQHAQDELRDLLVVQLRELADALDPSAGDVPLNDRRHELHWHRGRVQEVMAESLGGPPVNWRVRRTRSRVEQLRHRGDALTGLAMLVGGVAGSVSGEAAPQAPWGREVDEAAARALRATASVLEQSDAGDQADPAAELDAARAAHRELTRAITASSLPAEDLFPAGALAEGLRRTHDVLQDRTVPAGGIQVPTV